MATATVSIDSSTVAFSADTEGNEVRLAAMALQGAIDNGRSSDGWPSDPAEQAIRCTCAALVSLMRRSGMYQLHGDMADLIEAYIAGHAPRSTQRSKRTMRLTKLDMARVIVTALYNAPALVHADHPEAVRRANRGKLDQAAWPHWRISGLSPHAGPRAPLHTTEQTI